MALGEGGEGELSFQRLCLPPTPPLLPDACEACEWVLLFLDWDSLGTLRWAVGAHLSPSKPLAYLFGSSPRGDTHSPPSTCHTEHNSSSTDLVFSSMRSLHPLSTQ